MRVLPAVLLLGTAGFWLAARPADDLDYRKTEVMIPMRDGVRLHTVILQPADAKEKLPFLIARTPYGASTRLGSDEEALAREGYIFVRQDIRGRYGSEGQFVMLRPPRDKADPKSIDEGTDTYDTIEWLLRNVAGNNGKAGIFGVSYPGWLTVMATLEPHPALKAVSEQASPADMFLGDDFHHNGAFRLSYGFEYAALLESSRTNYHFDFDRHDTYDWYLGLGSLANANTRYFHGGRPTWNHFVEHPDYDRFWQRLAVPPYLDRVKVPNLHVAGWWDQEDFYGPVTIYEKLEADDPRGWNYLVAGPWNHGGWRRDGRTLGPLDFGEDPSRYFLEQVEAPWFAYWLKGKGALHLAEATVFETGADRWETYPEWPPRHDVTRRSLYLGPHGTLGWEAPAGAGGYDAYTSDPAKPVPYRRRPISPTYPGGEWPTWLLQDQRFVDGRPDVLTWRSEPLREDLHVAGDIVARFYASTSGTDCDWIVKLIDVYPDDDPQVEMRGYELMVADEVMRARFRASFVKPEPVPAGRTLAYDLDLHTNDHAFGAGHRIMVQIQSTWFPLIDRNPQKYVPNIFRASAADFQKAEQRIYRSRRFPSRMDLPVVRRGAGVQTGMLKDSPR